ncbi:hypothetical protein BDZ91DRAFT_648834 [Kalaharituber pfeilii]|nr:hypothetical protein BDZ91DRAFT_648834 [Kalaharituber pfeilii]
MPSDPRLDNILRALLQPWRPDTDTSRIYASAAAVLTTLTNPLNVTLLTTQILTAPAIWSSPDGLRSSLRVFGTFQSATLGKMELEVQGKAGAIGVQEWIGVVVRGANHNVPRWKHLLLLGGVGGGGNSYLIPRVTRRSLEDAFCRAVNLSLEGGRSKGEFLGGVEFPTDLMVMVMHDGQALLPAVVRSIYYSSEGFQSGYFLSKIENDVVVKDGVMAWPNKSNSLLELQHRLSRPLFTSMSSVARLAGTCVREARNPHALHAFLDRVAEFTHTLTAQWNMNRLSQVSMADEPKLIDPDSRRHTIPVVWQILKMVLFTTTLIVQDLATRLIQEEELAGEKNGPVITSKVLHIFRGLYFITSRMGTNAFTSYNFVYMTSIDILSLYEEEAEKFVRSIAPKNVGTIPDTLTPRIYDLYFLNTVEHLVPHLSAEIIEDLLIPLCTPYLVSSRDHNLRACFEAAHSVMLAIIANPGRGLRGRQRPKVDLEGKVLPFYAGMIFKSFPGGLSRRQFRLAISTLVKVCEVPGEGRDRVGGGGDAVMEMGWERAKAAPEIAVFDAETPIPAPTYSEKEIHLLALIDSLPYLLPESLQKWLGPLADLVARDVKDPAAKGRLRSRFWEVISGELDVERAEVAVRWWSEGGERRCFMRLGERKW